MKMEFQVGFLLSRVAWAMNPSVNRMLKENGLPDISVTYFGVLQVLWENDGISITDLGEKVQLEKSTMTNLIDRMETAQLLERQDPPTARKAYRICLTAYGKELEQKLNPIVSRDYRQLTRGILEKDAQTSVGVLKQLIENAQ
ncbi:MAG: MarR family transcriptional regulator [Deltaproteobacteria bacterium]|nr:MarR family transcriptional regulator [Deltaproteobacteria bacterium]